MDRWPIRSWNEDTRVRVAEDLWHATDPALWQDGIRFSLIEAYMNHRSEIYGGPLTLLFADQSDVLQFDARGDLQVASWTEIAAMMAPHIEEQRKKYEKRQQQDESNTIARSKLPPKRKLKAMHRRIDRLLELNQVTISEKGQQAIAYIRAMTTDDPDFGECVTFRDYLQHAFKKLPTDDPPDEPVAP